MCAVAGLMHGKVVVALELILQLCKSAAALSMDTRERVDVNVIIRMCHDGCGESDGGTPGRMCKQYVSLRGR